MKQKNMETILEINGGPDKEVRIQVIIDSKECGELSMERANATRFMDLLYPGGCRVISRDTLIVKTNDKKHAEDKLVPVHDGDGEKNDRH